MAPKLEAFVEAEYPAEAKKERLEASVFMELEIAADGSVTASRVLEPVGHGFDEAAVRASLQFRFRPATRDGQTTAAKIRYRYEFHLPVPAPALEPQTLEAPLPGSVFGSVSLAGSEGSGTRVAGARVTVASEHGQSIVAFTNAKGEFRFEGLPPGLCHLRIELEGFFPLERDIRLGSGQVNSIVELLVPQANDQETIEVDVREERPARETTRHSLSQRELLTVPGSNGDAIRAIQNLPGVVPVAVGSNQIIVRGTAPIDTLTFVDGVPVLSVYHVWGLSSVVPTEMLERLDFYPGNYSVKFGRGQGGLIDAAIRDPKTDGRYHGMAQLDIIDARAMLEGPLPGSKQWHFLGGVRRSHLDAVAMPVLGWPLTPVYNDYQLFLVNHPTPSSRIRIGIMGANDHVRFADESNRTQRPELNFSEGFTYFLSSYDRKIGTSGSYSQMFAFGRMYREFSFSSAERDYFAKAPVYPFGARSELSYKLLPWLGMATGLDVQYAPYRVTLQVPGFGADGTQASDDHAYERITELKGSSVHMRPAVYSEFVATPTERLRLVAGLRVDYADDTKRTDVSPRLTGRFDLVKRPRRTTVKGGVGLFYQPPLDEQTLPGLGNPKLKSGHAVQTSMGIEQQLASNVEASVEGFHYQLRDIVQRRPTANGGLDYLNTGSGYTLGLEVLLRVRPEGRFYGWLAYTLSRSMRRIEAGDPLTLFESDATHVLTALGSLRLGKGWELGSKFQYVSGNPYTPTAGALYSSSSDRYLPVFGATSSRRFPAYHEWTLRAQKRFEVTSSFSLTSYLDVINVYGKDRVIGIQCSPDVTRCNYQIHPLPVIPSLGLRGEF